MTSEVDICNQALGAAGARSTISSLTPSDGSEEANNCALYYGRTRDSLLRSALWNFAKKPGTLSLIKAAPGTPENPTTAAGPWSNAQPSPGWAYAYALPPDCLRIRRLLPQPAGTGLGLAIPLTPVDRAAVGAYGSKAALPFSVASDIDGNGNAIAVVNANVSQALALYTYRCVLIDLWDAQFQGAMVAALAANLAIPLSGDRELLKLNVELVRDAVNQARITDGNEGVARQDMLPDWLTVRGAGMAGSPLGWFDRGWDSLSLAGIVI